MSNAWAPGKAPTSSAALSWRISTLATRNTWVTSSNLSLLCPGPLTQGSRLTLKAQVAPPGQKCLPRAMRASLWWLLPSDGEFQSTPDDNQYYLASQGRRVVLRVGDVRARLPNSRINWIYDPHHNQSHRVKPRQTVPKINNNTVPKNNNVVQNSKSHARSPLETIPSASWYNSNLPLPSASSSRKNVSKHSPTVPRSNNNEKPKTTQVSNNANCSPPPP